MKEYLFIFRGGDPNWSTGSPEQSQTHMQRWNGWMESIAKAGRLVGGKPLERTGKQVTGIRKTVSDGPFAEGKELVGGYLIIKADSYEEAVGIAKGCPILELETGTVEVRAIQEVPGM